MSTYIPTPESFRGDPDQYIRTETFGRRLSVVTIAAKNVAFAELLHVKTHPLGIDMSKVFIGKNHSEKSLQQAPVVVTQESQANAARVMQPDQLGLHDETMTEWDHALVDIEVSAKTGDKTAIDENFARMAVEATFTDAESMAAEAQQYMIEQALADA